MLSKDPIARPTAKKILQNPYIKRHIMQLLEKTKKKSVEVPQQCGTTTENLELMPILRLGVKINPTSTLPHHPLPLE